MPRVLHDTPCNPEMPERSGDVERMIDYRRETSGERHEARRVETNTTFKVCAMYGALPAITGGMVCLPCMHVAVAYDVHRRVLRRLPPLHARRRDLKVFARGAIGGH